MLSIKNYLFGTSKIKYLFWPLLGYFSYRLVKRYLQPAVTASKSPIEVIRLIDSSIDHKESLFDAISPKMDAFEKK